MAAFDSGACELRRGARRLACVKCVDAELFEKRSMA